MIKSSFLKWTVISIIIFILLVFLIPNIFNAREREAFSDELRLENAKKNYNFKELPDSVVVSAGEYYKRSGFHLTLFGEKYRSLWATPVKLKILDVRSLHGGLKGEELGGGMQTIGMDMISDEGDAYDLRSVNKDQSKALPKWLQYSYARVMFRDQVAALNPYASLVIPTLAQAVDIMHTNPSMVFVPYDESMVEEYARTMAGRVAIIEEKPDETWVNSPSFNHAKQIVGTEEMLTLAKNDDITVDTSMYIRCRLFDILISDWDRHEGQWEWALVEKDGAEIFQPIPKDRDMALYKFNEGLLSSLALLINPKFQSFTKDYQNVAALTSNSEELDEAILGSIKDSSHFLKQSDFIMDNLSDEVVRKAFKQYPPEIFALVGEEHIEILKSRRDKLNEAASKFYEAIKAE